MSDLENLLKKLNTNFRLATEQKEIVADAEKSFSDILFHLPLITMIVLVVASRPNTKVTVEDVAHWVSRGLMELYSNFVYSLQRLRFSSTLRTRAVEAIVFLESMGFIEVSNDSAKSLKVTAKGRQFLSKYRYGQSEYRTSSK
jgi:hypothetical protein